MALVTAYKAYCRWDAASTITQRNKTLRVAKNNHRFQVGRADPTIADESDQSPPSQETAVAASILQTVSQMASCSKGDREIVDLGNSAPDLPCTLCHVPLTSTTTQYCMLNSCVRPFCALNASCTRSVRIDGMLMYCRMQCAQEDGRQFPHNQSLPCSQPSSNIVAPSKPTFTYDAISYKCNTCLLPITRDVRSWCTTCRKYVHKKMKGQPWCTREGWTKGGTMLVDSLISCIECRFAKDQEWLDFTKDTRQLAS